MSTRSYASYIRLDEILSAQHPTTPPQDAGTWAAERFFIITHQASELWLSQLLVDVEQAAQRAAAGEWEQAGAQMTRAASLGLVLCRDLEQLSWMCPPSSFAAFRPALQGASAGQSEQFETLLEILHGKSAARRALEAALAEHMTGDERCAPAAEGLAVLLQAISAWRQLHLLVAMRFLGNRPGTGGTSGVDYLRERLQDGLAAAAIAAGKPAPPPGQSAEVTLDELSGELALLESRMRSLRELSFGVG